jgi:nitrobenzene nitroreductase
MFAAAEWKPHPAEAVTETVDATIKARHAVRRFRKDPVPTRMIRDILDVARFAPSGTNIQPWRAWVVTGDARERLCAATLEALLASGPQPQEDEYKYYPAEFPEANLARRMAFGAAFGAAMGLAHDDMKGRMQQMARQFTFFDAPVGIIFTMDQKLEHGSFLDYGCFLQSIMIAAKARGLDTCAQQSWCQFHRVIRTELGIPESEMLVCGMSLGWADEAAPENNLDLGRAPVEDFATFCE